MLRRRLWGAIREMRRTPQQGLRGSEADRGVRATGAVQHSVNHSYELQYRNRFTDAPWMSRQSQQHRPQQATLSGSNQKSDYDFSLEYTISPAFSAAALGATISGQPAALVSPARAFHGMPSVAQGRYRPPGDGARSNDTHVRLSIGDVSLQVPLSPPHPERVPWELPRDNVFTPASPITKTYLRWVAQKELLNQDICFIGEPGPARRWLIMTYCHLTNREMQLLSLSRDTTESDIKQRREIRNGTLVYEDQPAVTAARLGQVLVLEGLEKVERNVLPVINNLLENREMHLDNGQMLIHPERYDRLLRQHMHRRAQRLAVGEGESVGHHSVEDRLEAERELEQLGLIRVSEKFRVVGLTVPVPQFEGNPLDPPLRSRFQCLYINAPPPAIFSAPDVEVFHATAAARARQQERPADAVAMENLRGTVESLRQSDVESIVKFRAAIEEINRATGDFAANTRSAPRAGSGATGAGVEKAPAAKSNALLTAMSGYELSVLVKQLYLFPDVPIGDILVRVFPWHLLAQQSNTGASGGAFQVEETMRKLTEYRKVLTACDIGVPSIGRPSEYGLADLKAGSGHPTERSAPGIQNRLQKVVSTIAARAVGSGMKGDPEGSESERRFNHVLLLRPVAEVQRSSDPRDSVWSNSAPFTPGEAIVASSQGTLHFPLLLGPLFHSGMLPLSGVELRLADFVEGRGVVLTEEHLHVLQVMLQSHLAGRHILLQGPTGCGKTTLVKEFAALLGYPTETVHLFADMTNKDLFQRRTTDSKTGSTTWENSALVEAARSGRIAVLDGVDKLPSGMVAALQELLVDGRATLCDGTVLKPLSEYRLLRAKLETDDKGMTERKIFPVHPAFRVVATAKPPSAVSTSESGGSLGRFRLSSEVTSIFNMVQMPRASVAATRAVLTNVAIREKRAIHEEQRKLANLRATGLSGRAAGAAKDPSEDRHFLRQLDNVVTQLMQLQDDLQKMQLSDPKIPQLTFRQLLHLVKFSVRFDRGLSAAVASTLLLSLLSTVTAQQVLQVIRDAGFGVPSPQDSNSAATTRVPVVADEPLVLEITEEGDCPPEAPSGAHSVFTSGGEAVLVIDREYSGSEAALVPFVPHFFSNPVQESIITWMAKQYAIGSNILLIGHQGVGKNKIVDSFLSRIRVPRHYIQLHRDTTVGSLTINPTVEGGKVVWADSPLVKAVMYGHCLVVDEIDKAPVEVVQVLKGLVEDHEMRLGDGRRISGRENAIRPTPTGEGARGGDVIAIHPDFRIIVLANPPGFPFHGNDFFRECGDLFVPYVIGNPDAESQLRVLREYGPDVPEALLVRLIAAFRRLQRSFEEGALSYPFSLRELIAVVRHMEQFPQDGVYESLNNVFNFDARDDATLLIVRQVLHAHLHPLVHAGGMKKLLPSRLSQQFPLRVIDQVIPLQLPELVAGSKPLQRPMQQLPVSMLSHFPVERIVTVPLIKEDYDSHAFTAAAHHSAATDSAGYTELLHSISLPFLRPSVDRVVGMTAGPVEASLISVLFVRSGGDGEGCRAAQLLLATFSMPSLASVDALLATAQARTARWREGEVHLLDLTECFPVTSVGSDAGIHLSSFDASSHGALVGQEWPPSGVLDSLVAVSDQSGNLLLVDVLASGLTGSGGLLGESRLNDDESASDSVSIRSPVRTAAVAHVSFLTVTPGVGSVSAWRAEDGTVAVGQRESSLLNVWMRNLKFSVTFPGYLEDVSFFASHLATVTLRMLSPVEATGGASSSSQEASSHGTAQRVTGVLKLSTQRGPSSLSPTATGEEATPEPRARVLAMFSPLPSAFAGGKFVDIVPQLAGVPSPQADAGDSAPTGGVITARDLRGAVFIPCQDGGDIAFMVAGAPQATSPAEGDATEAGQGVGDATMRVAFQAYQVPASTDSPASDSSSGSWKAIDSVRHQQLHYRSQHVTVYDFAQRTYRSFQSASTSGAPAGQREVFHVANQSGVAMTLQEGTQRLSSVDIDAERLEQRYQAWSSLLNGSASTVGAPVKPKDLSMEYSTPRKKPSGTLKHGKEDDEEHVGGNTYAGGTGGTDTAGLGGMVGPYRLDKGRPVHQVSPEEKKKIPPHLIEEARRMGREALKNRLDEIGMSASEYQHYKSFQERVRGQVGQLKSIFGGLKAAEGERVWIKGQTDGVWDDGKIVEGIVGEKNIFKRRIDSKENNPFQAKHKKRLLFVLDVSASMYRFEGMDNRLTKLLETTIMVMEAFVGLENKIDYAMIGHNGDSHHLPLVDFGRPPINQKERMVVCQKMAAYSQYCWSGDNTVEAMRESLNLVTQEKGDAYFVFVISDANLRQYGISPTELSDIIRAKPEVKMFCIFIASFGAEASRLQAQLPPGRGFECLDTQALPQVLKQIFSSVNLI